MNEDSELARKLQEIYYKEAAQNDAPKFEHKFIQSPVRYQTYSVVKDTAPKALSLIDGYWEHADPNPDVHALYLQFNDRFFWKKLLGIEVRWSQRMTLCAGVCSYEGRGGLCSIRLSAPLLKLRPRKDLVNTLLHEMIHAYLFVTQNNRDHDAHGPEFHKHMFRINKEAGTKITVYHSFHDEVDSYRQHWWKCDGRCQHRRPYFGLLKRAMNRAPSPLDPWWNDHKSSCGGTYHKIKEPEGYKGQKSKKTELSGTASKNVGDIRSFIPFSSKGNVLGESKTNKKQGNSIKDNGQGAIKSKTSHSSKNSSQNVKDIHSIIPFSGAGQVLGGSYEKQFNFEIKIKSKQNLDASWTQPMNSLHSNDNTNNSSESPDGSRIKNLPTEVKKRKILKKLVSPDKRQRTLPFIATPENAKDKQIIYAGDESRLNVMTVDLTESKPIIVACPVCHKKMEEISVNHHLDLCLNSSVL